MNKCTKHFAHETLLTGGSWEGNLHSPRENLKVSFFQKQSQAAQGLPKRALLSLGSGTVPYGDTGLYKSDRVKEHDKGPLSGLTWWALDTIISITLKGGIQFKYLRTTCFICFLLVTWLFYVKCDETTRKSIFSSRQCFKSNCWYIVSFLDKSGISKELQRWLHNQTLSKACELLARELSFLCGLIMWKEGFQVIITPESTQKEDKTVPLAFFIFHRLVITSKQ